jgi:hypothetical protein
LATVRCFDGYSPGSELQDEAVAVDVADLLIVNGSDMRGLGSERRSSLPRGHRPKSKLLTRGNNSVARLIALDGVRCDFAVVRISKTAMAGACPTPPVMAFTSAELDPTFTGGAIATANRRCPSTPFKRVLGITFTGVGVPIIVAGTFLGFVPILVVARRARRQ